jgi:hypothetical protein
MTADHHLAGDVAHRVGALGHDAIVLPFTERPSQTLPSPTGMHRKISPTAMADSAFRAGV